MITNLQLIVDEGELFENPETYRRLLGKLNYLTVTCHDIAYPVNIINQFMSSPKIAQWTALEEIFYYLEGSPRHGILYKKYGHPNVECFTNIDWASSKVDRRLTTGIMCLRWWKFGFMEE